MNSKFHKLIMYGVDTIDVLTNKVEKLVEAGLTYDEALDALEEYYKNERDKGNT